MFSAFPGGWPGVALLLLRVVVGATALVQGAAYLTVADPTVASWVGGMLAMIGGAALVIGFLTPGAGIVVGLGAFILTLFWSSLPPSPLLHDRLAAIFVLTDAAAIALLGPGAFSLDARLFGRREIIIPHESHPSRF
jgi:uncharacterized membrane protein YphA (DoxX/SURF4 family)